MGKTKVKDFNDLPFEERDKICYYTWQKSAKTIQQIILNYGDDISPRLKKELNEWKKRIESSIKENYEEVE